MRVRMMERGRDVKDPALRGVHDDARGVQLLAGVYHLPGSHRRASQALASRGAGRSVAQSRMARHTV